MTQLQQEEVQEKTWLAALVDNPGFITLLRILNDAAELQADEIELASTPSAVLSQVSDWKAFRRLVRLLHRPAEMKNELIRLRETLEDETNPYRDPLAPPVPTLHFAMTPELQEFFGNKR